MTGELWSLAVLVTRAAMRQSSVDLRRATETKLRKAFYDRGLPAPEYTWEAQGMDGKWYPEEPWDTDDSWKLQYRCTGSVET